MGDAKKGGKSVQTGALRYIVCGKDDTRVCG